jgi:hypothetical protein
MEKKNPKNLGGWRLRLRSWCQRALKTSQRGALENQPF